MTGLADDLRYAARALRHAPGFTTVAALVLALGIGAGCAVFSLLDAALVRPLPFDDAGRLVMLWERAPRFARNRVSPLNFLDWSEQQRSFASIAAVAGGGRTLTTPGAAPERIPGQAVTSQFFDVLGVQPVAGRTFTPEDVRGRASVAIVSESFWRGRFGGDAGLIGRPLLFDGEPLTIIGVMPATFRILYRADMWTLFVPRRSPEQRRQHYLQIVGRLKPDVTLAQARADMATIADRIANLSPETNRGWGVTIEPLRDAIVGADLRTTSVLLAAVVGFVLLMACANVANLLLARGQARSREMAIRAAIGGSRARIVRQLFAESLLLSAAGGAGGLLLARAAIRAAPVVLPPDTLPMSIVLVFDARVAAAALALSLATALLCGLAPAWQTSNTAITGLLASGGRTATTGRSMLRPALVVAEIAAAVLVVTGAGLLIRTLLAIQTADPGFRAERVLTGSISLPLNAYRDTASLLRFYDAAERELAAIPGVTSAALGGKVPLDGWDIGMGFDVVGDPPADPANSPLAHYQIVGADYFRTLGIELVRGRPFTRHDTGLARPVCIVDEEFVRQHGNGRDPIGMLVNVRAMDLRGPTPVVREVVGVVRHVAETAAEADRGVQIYVPIAQNPWFTASIALRTTGDPLSLAGPMKAAIARVDPNQAVTRIRTIEEIAADASSEPRFRARLLAVFAVLALTLAGVGIFGVLAYSVHQRGREFAIRIALGARAHDVLRLVLRGAAAMTGAGIAIGAAAAAALARFMSALLYRVEPLDPVTFSATSAILACAALAASAVPVWRSLRIDPAAALRQD